MARRLPFHNRRIQLIGLAIIAAVLPVAWYLGSPLLINRTIDESFPGGGAAGTVDGSGVAAALSSGQFGAVDSIHKGSGTATIFRLPDGQRILRFENFRVQNGPDLYVYLSGHPKPLSSAELHEGGAFEVARLKANIGDQNYTLPNDLDLSRYSSAVIYCKRFSQVFSPAELVPLRLS